MSFEYYATYFYLFIIYKVLQWLKLTARISSDGARKNFGIGPLSLNLALRAGVILGLGWFSVIQQVTIPSSTKMFTFHTLRALKTALPVCWLSVFSGFQMMSSRLCVLCRTRCASDPIPTCVAPIAQGMFGWTSYFLWCAYSTRLCRPGRV